MTLPEQQNTVQEPIQLADQVDNEQPEQQRRSILTFMRRSSPLNTSQTKALEQYKHLIVKAPVQDARQLFEHPERPLTLEIGFGMGDATAKIAQTRAGDDFLCCEVHAPGVGALLKRCGEENIGNIRIVQHDAIEVMDHMLGENSLDGVHIFFPDPWHKSRHHKRRLIQSPFVNRLALLIKQGGYLHLATDWQPYAEQMLQVLSAEPLIKNTATDPSGFAEKPSYRPLTKFENRGLKLGHGVWDLVFEKL